MGNRPRKGLAKGVKLAIAPVLVAVLAVVALVFWLRPKDDVLPFQTLLETVQSMEFVPVQPANQLVRPGTLVQILTTDPLCVSTVCAWESSLGAQLKPAESSTFDLQQKKTFSAAFELQGPDIDKLAGVTLKDVVSVELKLSNVKILEIADAEVLKHLSARTPECTAAAQLRKNADHQVTLVKAALVADVVYSVSFAANAEANLVTDQLAKLAKSLDASIGSAGDTTLRGQQLIWGIRDDILLGSLSPGELPPAGSAERRASLPVAATAKVVEPLGFISLSVEPIRQDKPMACWAASGAMLHSWHARRPVDVDRFLESAGPRWKTLYDKDVGLSVSEQAELARAMGLVEEPPQNFTTRGYADLLRERGPLWITTGDLVKSHARVLVGLVEGATEAETFFEYLDPRDGTRHYERADEFHEDFELEARRVLGIGSAVELRKQILHF